MVNNKTMTISSLGEEDVKSANGGEESVPDKSPVNDTQLCRRKKAKKDKNKATFKCRQKGCNRVFSAKAHLITHQYSHNKAKKFKCPHCDISYSRARRLDLHKLSHVFQFAYLTNDRSIRRKGLSAPTESVTSHLPSTQTS